jgi:hypothetical protein
VNSNMSVRTGEQTAVVLTLEGWKLLVQQVHRAKMAPRGSVIAGLGEGGGDRQLDGEIGEQLFCCCHCHLGNLLH